MLRALLKPVPLLFCALFSVPVMAAEESGTPAAGPAPAEALPDILPEERSTVLPAPVPEGVPSLQMSTDYGSPILALGGYRPAGEMQGGAIRVDPFTIRAAVHAAVGYNDNVTLSSTNKVGSMLLSLTPSITVGLEGATQRYYLVYRGNYGVYTSSSVDNYSEHNIGFNAANEWSGRLRTLLRYEFVSGQDARGATTTATTEPETWQVNAVRGSVSYGAPGAPGRLEGQTAYITKRYTDSQAATPGRDYDQFDLGGLFSWRVAPKTHALAEIRRSEIRHDGDTSLDSTEMRYLVGARWDATAQTNGSLRLGYLTRDFSEGTRPNFSGFTYEADATWTPLSYSAVGLRAARTTSEAVEPGSSFVVNLLTSVFWTHAWSDRVRSFATFIRGQDDHEGVGRTDTLYVYGLKATYAFARRVRLGAEIRHDSRSSPLPTFEYRRNLTLMTVEASL